MKRATWIICLMVFVCAVSFTTVWAQEKKPDAVKEEVVKPTAKDKAAVAKGVDLFYKVVSYGETEKNPLIIIAAVKLLDDLSFSSIAKPGQEKGGTATYDRTALINMAKEYAANDTELLAVIAKVQDPPEQTAVRGHHGGPHGYYGHGPRGGHWGGHHGRGHWGCVWHQRCRHGFCEWVCR